MAPSIFTGPNKGWVYFGLFLLLAGIIALILWLAGVFDKDDAVTPDPGTVSTTTPTPTPTSRLTRLHF